MRRPLAVVVIGDGFTRSLCSFLRIGKYINTSPSKLLPCPTYVQYLPGMRSEERSIPIQPLWVDGPQNLFPELQKYLLASPSSFGDLCARLAADGPLNPTFRDDTISYRTDLPGYQLRAYLWYLFKFYDSRLGPQIESGRAQHWPWNRVIRGLRDYFEIQFVSFNYDIVLERMLTRYHGICPETPWEQASAYVRRRVSTPAPPALVLKPHGSIAFDYPGCDHHWKSNVVIHNERLVGMTMRTRFPPADCPARNELIPPGHTLEHLIDPYCTVPAACRDVLAVADVVIVCGLSAHAPDTDEVKSYFRSIPTTSRKIFVGIESECPAAKLLENSSPKQYSFVPGMSENLADLVLAKCGIGSGLVRSNAAIH